MLNTLWAITAAYLSTGQAVENQYKNYLERLKNISQQTELACQKIDRNICRPLTPEPYKPLRSGYQILPELLPDLPYRAKTSGAELEQMHYSWPRTLVFINRENSIIEECEEKLKSLSQLKLSDSKQIMAATVSDLLKLRAAQLTIAEHLKYNWFWQKKAEEQPGVFAKTLEPQELRGLHDVKMPSFLKIENNIIQATVWSDIRNAGFLKKFKTAVEREWQTAQYKVKINLNTWQPKSAPALAKAVDVETHLKSFNEKGFLLTTGAERSFERLGFAIVLGPERLRLRELAHKFGHLLGFPDFYLRAARNLGEQGFEISEAVDGSDDLMADPQRGKVSDQHFRALIQN